MLRTLLLLCCLGWAVQASAQAPHPCGTVEGRSEWLKKYQQRPHEYRKDMDSVIFIPLTIHLLGSDNGLGYFPPSQLVAALCKLNADFLQTGLQFFVQGDIRYIPSTAWDSHSTILQGAEMMFANNVPNTLNSYFVSDPAGNCGYNLRYAGVAIRKSCAGPNDHTWAHEVGHALAIPHPFLGWEGGVSHDNSVPHNFNTPAPEFVTYDYTFFKDTLILDTLIIDTAWVERVDGSNCHFAADGFCDTSPDYLAGRWTCNNNGESTQLQTDPDGATFRSDGTLIMGYANDNCQTRFTTEQIEAMRAFLFDRRAYWISTQPPAPVIPNEAPTALFPIQGEPAQFNDVQLRWTQTANATHYVVQVSRLVNFSVLEEFMVADTTLVLSNLLTNRTYYWRVKPINNYNFCTLWSATANFVTATISSTGEGSHAGKATVYPNPVRGGQEVFVQGLVGVMSFELFSPLGIRVASAQPERSEPAVFRLPANLPSGVYYLSAETQEGSAVFRLVVSE